MLFRSLNSRKVSRRHCCIAQVENYLVVRDLGSTNGIRINGVRVLEGRLKAGDELTIGNFRYQITWDDKPMQAPPTVQKSAGKAKVKKAPVHSPTESDEDQVLESCDEPIALGGQLPPSPDPAPKQPKPNSDSLEDSSSMLPDDVKLQDPKPPRRQ